MNRFTINANECLHVAIDAYYHSEYRGHGSRAWSITGSIENTICTLKNDINIRPQNDEYLQNAISRLNGILSEDLNWIKENIESDLTVCIVPRAKVHYLPHQLMFKRTVAEVVNILGFNNGAEFITRTSDTATTHRYRAGYGGNGSMPYVGISNDTCSFSEHIRGQNILLIDDVYTNGVNIDEDMIQALLDKGAERVIFYSVGYTI